MAGSRGEDHQELCHTGISTPRGGPWRTSNVDGILRSLRLDAEAAAARAAAGGDRRESAASRPRAAPGAHRDAASLRTPPPGSLAALLGRLWASTGAVFGPVRPDLARIGRIRVSGALAVKPLDRCVCQAALHSGAMEPALSSDKNRHRYLLGRAGAAHEEALEAATGARRQLDEAIVAASPHLSTREMADLVGLSHATVAAAVRRVRGNRKI